MTDNRIRALAAAMAAAALLLLFGSFLSPGDLSFFQNGALDFSGGWTSDALAQPFSLPTRLPAAAGQSYTVENQLPADLGEGMYLLLRTSQQELTVSVGGEEVYALSYGPDAVDTVSRWNLVPLSRDMAGGQVRVTLRCPYKEFSGVVNGVLIGRESELYYAIFFHYGYLFAVALLVLVSAAGLLLMYAAQRRMPGGGEFLLLGLFSLLVAGWLLGESKMMQFFTGNVFAIASVSYLCLPLIPVPMLLYIARFLSGRAKAAAQGAAWIGMGCLGVVLSLRFFAKVPFFSSMWLSHGALILSIAAALALLIYERAAKKNRKAGRLLKVLAVLMLAGAVELANIAAGDFTHVSRYIGAAMLVFIAILAHDSYVTARAYTAKARRARYYEELAYKDQLTGGKNRMAFYRDAEALFSAAEADKPLWVYYFDLNFLKALNDEYGHLEGDRALKMCYACIAGAFGQENAYRIGGDEFAALICADEALARTCEDAFLAAVEEKRRSLIYPFDVAMGMSSGVSGEKSLERLCAEADSMMYQKKRLMKETAAAQHAPQHVDQSAG